MSKAEALRSRFILSPLPAALPHPANGTGQPAAVLILLVERQNELFVLLTRRSLQLRHHAGQICFPGGKYDLVDGTLQQTALRETYEDLGFTRDLIQIWGELAVHNTVSGFAVTPFVAAVMPDYQLQVTTEEVAEVFELPLQPLLETANYGHWQVRRAGQTHTVIGCSVGHRLIWGATARILFDLARHLNGSGSPTIHTEATQSLINSPLI